MEKEEEVQKELSQMMESLNRTSTGEPEPEPKVEEVKEEPKVEPEPEPVSEAKAEEVKEPELVPEPVKKPEEPVLDEKDKVIADLRTKLAEKEIKKEEPPKKEEPEEPKFDEQDFMKDVDLDELTRDPKEFNKTLNRIYQKAVIDSHKTVLQTLPDIVKAHVLIMDNIKKTRDKFYEENEDLKQFGKVVAIVFEEVASANQNKSYDEIINLVGPEVRKRLDLPKVAGKAEKEEKLTLVPPKLPHKGAKAGKVQEKSSTNPLQDELEEMTKVLGR